VSLTGPGSAIAVTGVNPVTAGATSTQFDITFAPQNATGVYTLVLGPDIQDAQGHSMDQNNNGITGEVPGDRYTSTFSINLFGPDGFGYIASAGTFQNLELAGQPGVFTILASGDDSSAAVNLGSNTFSFYGTSYSGATALYVSTNGLITFGSA